MKKLTFVVCVDRYHYNSGGNHVLHILAQMLHDFGEEVYTFGVGRPGFDYKVLEIENFDPVDSLMNTLDENNQILTKLDYSSTIFICFGLFNLKYLKGKKVARWIQFFDQDIVYDDDSLVFFQYPAYNTQKRNFDGYLNIIDFQVDYWYKDAYKRPYFTYLCKKASWSDPNLEQTAQKALSKAASIFGDKEYLNLEPLAGLKNFLKDEEKLIKPKIRNAFQRTAQFICFDNSTSHSVFASLCGADSIIVPNTNINPEEYRNSLEYLKYGVAYGFDDLDHMYKTKHLVKQHITDLYNRSFDDVKNFIKTCYNKI